MNRRENDYEFLFFGVINVFVSVFILVNKNSSDFNLVLANSFLFYAFSYIVNKMFNVFRLFKAKSINFIPKCSISILVFVISILAVMTVSEKSDVAFMIYGYYFVAFGLLSILEVLLIILMNGKTFKKKVMKFLNYKEEKKETPKKFEMRKIKQVRGKRITPKKEEVKEVEEKVENKKKVKNKKR